MPNFFYRSPGVCMGHLHTDLSCRRHFDDTRMGIAAYPDIAPPQVTVTATYPGASAATMESTAGQVIEQQLTGIDNLLYFTSTSNSNGTATITLSLCNRHQPGHRRGAGAEQGCSGAAPVARRGHAAGRHRREGQPRHPVVRGSVVRQPLGQCGPSQRYPRLADPTCAVANQRHWQHFLAGLGICDTHLAGYRQAAGLRGSLPARC